MKAQALSLTSLTLSIVALSYAAWLHQHSERMAVNALKKREAAFVQSFAPKIQSAYQSFGVTNVVSNAQTLEELFGPYVEMMNRMAGEPYQEDEQKN